MFLLKGPLAPPGHPGTQASLGCDLSLAPKVERSLWTWSRSQAGAQGTADGGGGAAENEGHSGKVYAAAAKRACAGRGGGGKGTVSVKADSRQECAPWWDAGVTTQPKATAPCGAGLVPAGSDCLVWF